MGRPRSATTWLHRALTRHPGFHFPAAKETRHFTAHWTDTGLAAYTAQFVGAAGRITGEFTTAYGMLPRLARLAAFLEDRLNLPMPKGWAPSAAEKLTLFDDLVIELRDGRFTAAGLRPDYPFDLWWRLGGGSEEDLPEIRQARIPRQMNAELFYKP